MATLRNRVHLNIIEEMLLRSKVFEMSCKILLRNRVIDEYLYLFFFYLTKKWQL